MASPGLQDSQGLNVLLLNNWSSVLFPGGGWGGGGVNAMDMGLLPPREPGQFTLDPLPASRPHWWPQPQRADGQPFLKRARPSPVPPLLSGGQGQPSQNMG